MSTMTTTRRKLTIATWAPPTEGNILGKVTLDVTEALRFIAHMRDKTGEKVSITHLVGKAVANALATAPGINGKIVFGRFVPFDSVDVTFLIAADGDLGKAKIENADNKSILDITRELSDRASKVRSGEDASFKKAMDAVRATPWFLVRPILRFTGWLASGLGISIKALGVERHAFGSCMITSVGMFGFDEGYAPFTPFARVPLLVTVGAIHDGPIAVDGKLECRPLLTVTATIDHRFIDGAQLGALAKEFRAVFDNPFALDTSAEQPPAEAAG